jgi:CubicO group peptidase (beta-lactamase class C family)
MSGRLLPIAVAALLSSAARPSIGQADAARAARLARVADSLGAVRVHEGVTGLVIGVYHGERPLYVHALGLADEASGRAMATGQAMDVASITKQFTAAGVLRLVDQGKVALDAPLSRYVTDAGPTLGVVTVRQLLNQTSGVGHYEPAFQTHAPQSRDDILRVLRDAPADAAAGTRFTYNNAVIFDLESGRATRLRIDSPRAKAPPAPRVP